MASNFPRRGCRYGIWKTVQSVQASPLPFPLLWVCSPLTLPTVPRLSQCPRLLILQLGTFQLLVQEALAHYGPCQLCLRVPTFPSSLPLLQKLLWQKLPLKLWSVLAISGLAQLEKPGGNHTISCLKGEPRGGGRRELCMVPSEGGEKRDGKEAEISRFQVLNLVLLQ